MASPGLQVNAQKLESFDHLVCTSQITSLGLDHSHSAAANMGSTNPYPPHPRSTSVSLSLSLRLYGGECPDWGAEEAREEVLQLGWRAAE